MDGPEGASVVVCCSFLKPRISQRFKESDDVDAPIAGVIFPLAWV
jgi:hypothetical protein